MMKNRSNRKAEFYKKVNMDKGTREAIKIYKLIKRIKKI